LDQHHDTAAQLWVGFHKKGTGKQGVRYAEAVDQALCYGWIDGIRKRVDAETYVQRFSPRTARSIWSSINARRVEELTELGLMHPSGRAVFDSRDRARTGLYSFENRPKTLEPALERRFRADKKAWAFFQAQPPGYRRLAIFVVMSAKRDETKERRLLQLMEASARKRRRF
jgi:uncharacterized protein YdeI (YjbR/CyaY-like superfamily)